MEGFLNFLADHYIWFAGVSVFFAFALIGLVYESKKKKKEESKTADAVAQPLTADATSIAPEQTTPGVVVDTPQQTEIVQPGTPSLEGLEAQTDSFVQNDIQKVGESETLVLEDTTTPSAEPSLVIEDTQAPAAEPTLVIEDTAAPASEEPSLVIEDKAAPAAEAPAENPTLGNPGQPPM